MGRPVGPSHGVRRWAGLDPKPLKFGGAFATVGIIRLVRDHQLGPGLALLTGGAALVGWVVHHAIGVARQADDPGTNVGAEATNGH